MILFQFETTVEVVTNLKIPGLPLISSIPTSFFDISHVIFNTFPSFDKLTNL